MCWCRIQLVKYSVAHKLYTYRKNRGVDNHYQNQKTCIRESAAGKSRQLKKIPGFLPVFFRLLNKIRIFKSIVNVIEQVQGSNKPSLAIEF